MLITVSDRIKLKFFFSGKMLSTEILRQSLFNSLKEELDKDENKGNSGLQFILNNIPIMDDVEVKYEGSVPIGADVKTFTLNSRDHIITINDKNVGKIIQNIGWEMIAANILYPVDPEELFNSRYK